MQKISPYQYYSSLCHSRQRYIPFRCRGEVETNSNQRVNSERCQNRLCTNCNVRWPAMHSISERRWPKISPIKPIILAIDISTIRAPISSTANECTAKWFPFTTAYTSNLSVHQLSAKNSQLKEFVQLATSIDNSQPALSSSTALTDVDPKSALMLMFKCTLCPELVTFMGSSNSSARQKIQCLWRDWIRAAQFHRLKRLGVLMKMRKM